MSDRVASNEHIRFWGLYAGILIILAVVVYGQLITHSFGSDDRDYLKQAAAVVDNPTLLARPTEAFSFGRPTTEWVFLLGVVLWGENVALFHGLQICLHLIASFLLARFLWRLGIARVCSGMAGVIFLVHVAHFRSVHWISCLAYPLALILGLCFLLFFLHYLESGRLRELFFSGLFLLASIGAHPTAVVFAVLCLYLAWRHTKSYALALRLCWSLVVVAAGGGFFIFAAFPNAPQHAGVSHPFEFVHPVYSLLWYLGRIALTSVWLPTPLVEPSYFELALGAIVCLGMVYILIFKETFASLGSGWTLLCLLPFLNNQDAAGGDASGPSRFLYLALAGFSLLLSLGIYEAGNWAAQRYGDKWQKALCGLLFVLIIMPGLIFSTQIQAASLYMSGRLYDSLGERETSVSLYERALTSGRELLPLDVYTRLAAACLGQGQSPVPVLRRALNHIPEVPRIQIVVAAPVFLEPNKEVWQQGYEKIGAVLKSIQDDSRVFQETALIFQNLANYHRLQNRHTLAVELYQKALQLHPGYDRALLGLGASLLALDKTVEAAQAFETILVKQPNHTRALENLGRIKMDTAPNEAIRLFNRAVKTSPNEPPLYYSLAAVLLAQNRPNEAAQALQKAVKLEPNRPDAWFALARVYDESSQHDAAIQAYRQVLSLRPGYKPAEARLQILRNQ